ncbi:nitric oxide-associated protein 1 [Condylostylus longicornis]|uniref:nitric oxide-associated protein 1 n=1 Tax=Condylostylus longicornis TaxID=2530218 RepID=UPI00244DBC47|nr:nitric oxide-associated protein 1 [Condylostylus longicornis]
MLIYFYFKIQLTKMFSQKIRVFNLLQKLRSPWNQNKISNHNLPKSFQESKSLKSSCFNDDVLSKILYSSFLDMQKLKLGYVGKMINQDIMKKRKFKKAADKIREKPFSVALKYLDVDTNIRRKKERNSDNLTDETTYQAEISNFPKSWLDEYEFYNENDESKNSEYGTCDPHIPPSNIPCGGCGAHLHCVDPGYPGYIPLEIFNGRTDEELKTVTCQRCHFLKHYNIALDIALGPEDYIKMLSVIKDKFALAVLIIDLTDFPCSISPELKEIIGEKRPVVIVGNKVDLLPNDSKGYIANIKNVLIETVNSFGLDKINLKETCLISAKTGYGVEELITVLHKIWKYNGDVYLMGCANAGKSSLFNALLKSDYCKVEATDIIKRATTCSWPGTTLKFLKFPILRPSDIRVYERFRRLKSEQMQKEAEKNLRRDQLSVTGKIRDATLIGHIGTTFKNITEVNDPFSPATAVQPILTLDENSKIYSQSKWCYDTPGVIHSEQLHDLLTTEELLLAIPTQMITPRAFKIAVGMTLFLAGLGRIDFVSGNLDYVKLYVFSSLKLPILITNTVDAKYVYHKLLGSPYLQVPKGDIDRLAKWPALESSEIIVEGIDKDIATSDILLSSAGWVSLKLSNTEKCKFLVWSPEKRGIFLRKPALVRYPDKLCGNKIRKSLAYKIGKPFVLYKK